MDEDRDDLIGATTTVPITDVQRRQDLVRAEADRRGFDALVVVGRSFYDRCGDLAYLTNHFPPFPTAIGANGISGLGHAFLILPHSGDPMLLTDLRRHRQDIVAVRDTRAHADLESGLIEALQSLSLAGGRVGVAGLDILPATLDRRLRDHLPELTFVDAGDTVSSLRQVKEPMELDLLRSAARCADTAQTAAHAAMATPGARERDLAAAGMAAAVSAGADFIRYFRVHSGPWSTSGSRWPPAMDRRVGDGELVVTDVIGTHRGYQFDVNRTFGKPDLPIDALEVAKLVEEATLRAVEACRAGTAVEDVATAARDVFARSPYAAFAGASMGHGIGLETVELPYIRAGDRSELRPRMVLCVEPTLSVPGIGGAAIEQMVIIRAEGGPEVITTTPTDLW